MGRARHAPSFRTGRAPSDPLRLLRDEDAGVGDLVKAYTRRTRPGDHETIAAWYRLRPRLETRAPDAAAPSRAWRWSGARLLSGAATAAAVILLIVVQVGPQRATPATTDQARSGAGPGGGSGWRALGAGGAEGSSGARDQDRTAMDDGRRADPRRAG